jgi:putative peptide zinc metalloprotease protein
MQELLHNRIPKLNPGIVIHCRDNEYILSFKDNNCHLKINLNIYTLINLIDNHRSLGEIVSEYNKYFEKKIDVPLTHELLFNKLGYYNIVETEFPETDREKFNSGKSPSYLKLNYIFINAYYTELITRPFAFLFKLQLMKVILFFCISVFSVCFILNYKEIIIFIRQIPPVHYFIYIGFLIISSIFHEMGHAAATYHFGGKHSGIGFGFYLLTPVLYSDVTSAWKFNTKERVIVNLAGIYFELVFGTVLILFALLIDNKTLLIIPFIIFIKTLFNLNPFFRTDGYWVLSDLIKIPNLRKSSNDFLSDFLHHRTSNENNRLKNYLILYALISNSFIIVFLLTILIINPNSLITFPFDIFTYVNGLLCGNVKLTSGELSKFIIPFMFYFLLFRWLLISRPQHYLKKAKSKK